MEENKVVEMGMEAIGNVNGNLKVVAITAVATLATSAGVYFAVKKGTAALKARKDKKSKVVDEAPEKETKKK